jgi:broad specificity phosphatase PhoE
MPRRFTVALFALMLQLLISAAADAAVTVVLVRHAEKETQQAHEDPGLTSAGQARAAELVRVLADVNVVAVYSSPFARTRDTVAPLAETREIEIRERDPRAGMALAKEIREHHHEGVVVVSGHSNTIPDLARALGVDTDLTYAEQDYDDLLIVTLHDDGSAEMLHLHYGAPTE